MNRSYRLVWNELSQRLVAAPEHARGRGQRSGGTAAGAATARGALRLTAVAASLISIAGAGWAAAPAPGTVPTGAVVTSGTVTVAAPVALPAGGNQLVVTQSTPKAVINWSSFDVASNSVVTFNQPSATASVLNRVTAGTSPSQIFGQIQANGQVVLVNSNGVLFGQGSSVSVHGLMTSTLDLSDANFNSGVMRFNGAATPGAFIRNEGTITTDAGGHVALISAGEVTNAGTISASAGSVVLAGGTDVTINVGTTGLISAQLAAPAPGANPFAAAVNNSGQIEAKGAVVQGGVIELIGDVVNAGGTLDVSGTQGGSVTLQATSTLMQSGAVHADGSAGSGGSVRLTTASATATLLQTQSSLITADGAGAGSGGQVQIDGWKASLLSGRIQAGGQTGGSIRAAATTLNLAGAHWSVDGSVTGGQILLGGDAVTGGSATTPWVTHPVAAGLATATDVNVNQSTTLSALGTGGKITVSADRLARYDGTATTGPNGQIVLFSGQAPKDAAGATLAFGIRGSANPGTGGTTQVLSNDNIVLDTTPARLDYILLPSTVVQTGQQHGSGGVVELGPIAAGGSAQQILVASPNDSLGTVQSGGVYVFDPRTGQLLSTFLGAGPAGHMGSGGMTRLANGNVVINSPQAQSGAGAVTLVTPANALGGSIPLAQTNSVIGANPTDALGSGGITALPSGNYVISSPMWSGQLGAVTAINGQTGLTAVGASRVISGTNSLTGQNGGDRVGSGGVTALLGDNYVVSSPDWSFKAAGQALNGAVTWVGAGSAGAVVSDTNSLFGASTGDRIGSGGVTALTQGNFVVSSPLWSSSRGAATWGNGSTGSVGPVDAANSLVGAAAGDQVSSGGVVALTNGNYVVSSPVWSNGTALNAGAVTWGNGASGLAATVGATNSLVGSTTNDQLGSAGVTALSNGNYVVASPLWDGPNHLDNVGAVTWANGTTGQTGGVDATNSLTGSQTNDKVGSGGVTALGNGNYLVSSPLWSNGALKQVGAATWGDGGAGLAGPVSAANSLTGSTANDQVSSGGIAALRDGSAVVSSPLWDKAGVSDVGAVTPISGTAATSATVTAANSVTGSATNDQVGSGGVTALNNADFVIVSPSWSNGPADMIGAVTPVLASGFGAAVGQAVTQGNSLTGLSANDLAGTRVTPLSDGSFVLSSPNWSGLGSNGSGNGLQPGNAPGWVNSAPTAGQVVTVTTKPAWTLAQLAPAGTTLKVETPQTIINNGAATLPGQAVLHAGTQLTLNAALASTEAVPTALTLVVDGSPTSAFINNAGATALSTPNSQWQVWSWDPANDTRGGLTYAYKQYDATYAVTPVQGTGNGVLYRVAPVITPTLAGTVTKVYDTTAAVPATSTPPTIVNALTQSSSGAIDGDTVTLTPGTSAYATANAGTGIDVTATGLAVASATAPGGVPVYGYKMASTSATAVAAGTITPAPITVPLAVDPTRVYDATPTATGVVMNAGASALSATNGVLGTDSVTLNLAGWTPTAAFADKNVGAGKTVTVDNVPASPLTGPAAANYQLVTPTTTASITPKLIDAVLPTTAQNKYYDGNTSAQVAAPAVALSGVIGGDQVNLVQSGQFGSSVVGNGKSVSVSRALGGIDGGNYALNNPADVVNADILPLPTWPVPVIRNPQDVAFGSPLMQVSRVDDEEQVMAVPKPKPEAACTPKEVIVEKVTNHCPTVVTPEPTPQEPKKVIVVSGDVLFDWDKSELRPEAKKSLDALVPGLQDSSKIVIVGHTDSSGRDSRNQQLSVQRASAVRDYLIQRGIPAERIADPQGMSSKQPVADNTSETGRARNRRVEIRVH